MATWARVKGQVSHTVLGEKKVCQNIVPVTFIPTAHDYAKIPLFPISLPDQPYLIY